MISRDSQTAQGEDHPSVEDMITFLDHDSGWERKRIEGHLEICDRCRVILDRHRRLLALYEALQRRQFASNSQSQLPFGYRRTAVVAKELGVYAGVSQQAFLKRQPAGNCSERLPEASPVLNVLLGRAAAHSLQRNLSKALRSMKARLGSARG